MKFRSFTLIILVLFLTLIGCTKESTRFESGKWEGIVSLGTSQFFIGLEAIEEDQQLLVTIGELLAADVPARDVSVSEDQWSFSVRIGTSSLQFLLNPTEEGFDGKVLYDTKSGTVVLRPGRYSAEYRKIMRPEQFGIPISVDTSRARLHGTYLTPEGDGPFPTVLIIAGSGPTDRDGNSELIVNNNDNLWHLAQELQQAGIATVRYDKLGVGESMPEDLSIVSESTFDHYVEDAVHWIRFLKERVPEVGPIGIAGHSEGSLIALLAAQAEPVDFVISMAGNGDLISDQMVKQVSRINAEAAEVLEKRFEQISQNRYEETGNLMVDTLVPLGKELYLQTWMQYDPTEVLRSLDIPALVIWGANDERLHDESGLFGRDRMPPTVSFVEIQQMGHMLRKVEADADLQRSYMDRTMELHPRFLTEMIQFIQAQSSKGGL